MEQPAPSQTIARPLGKWGGPTFTQAQKIVARFGGEAATARAIGISRISVYRWSYRRPYGCDGLIPASMVDRIQVAARLEGILLTAEDWEPERKTTTDHPPVPGDPEPPTLAGLLA